MSLRYFSFRVTILGLFLLILASEAVLAAGLTHESFIGLESAKEELVGATGGEQFGANLLSGDFNSDGRDDLIVAAPFASKEDRTWNGKVEVFFGGNTQADIVFWGEAAGDQLGTSLALGDLNNDGVEDLIIGAHNAQTEIGRTGKVYVVDGADFWQDFEATVDSGQASGQVSTHSVDFSIDKPLNVLTGVAEADGFGVELAVLDLNNDGRDDLLVGAPFATAFSVRDAGIVYAYFGRDIGLADRYNLFFYGPSNNQRFGSAITSGDYNSDGRTDLAIGAYLADQGVYEQAGKVYLYEGKEVFKVTNGVPDYELINDKNGDWFGFALDTGDFNGDFVDDLVVGSFPYAGNRGEGSVEIYYGGDLANMKAKVLLQNPLGQAMFASKFSSGDINGDGFEDLLIGAPGVSLSKSDIAGDVYVLEGGNLKPRYDVASYDLDNYIRGEFADDWFGSSLDLLDFNGDGFEDLAVGARYFDSSETVNNGKVVILYGDGEPFGTVKSFLDTEGEFVSRGKMVNVVIDRLDLRHKKANIINSCYEYLDFCFFNFTAMSSFAGMQLEPELLLYPDVPTDHLYAEDVQIGTVLGFINGYMGEDQSPFKPARPVTRIEALKVVLSAADVVPSKYRFELEDILGSREAIVAQLAPFADVDARIDYMWWYPRYLNFALDKGLIDEGEFFRPDENISVGELKELLDRLVLYLETDTEGGVTDEGAL
jgi:hypothetical protein